MYIAVSFRFVKYSIFLIKFCFLSEKMKKQWQKLRHPFIVNINSYDPYRRIHLCGELEPLMCFLNHENVTNRFRISGACSTHTYTAYDHPLRWPILHFIVHATLHIAAYNFQLLLQHLYHPLSIEFNAPENHTWLKKARSSLIVKSPYLYNLASKIIL